MPDKIIRQVVEALKREFRGQEVEIPIAMREEPAVTMFPGLVEDEPVKTNATALGAFDSLGPIGNPLAGLEAPPAPSESFSTAPTGVSDEPLFAPADLDRPKILESRK